MAPIYQTNQHRNNGCMLISTHRLLFINLDTSVWYDQISCQVSPCVCKSEMSEDLYYSVVSEDREEITVLDRCNTVLVQKDR